MFIQSFEQANLRELRKRTRVRLIQLSERAQLFDDGGLKAIAAYADGIGAEKKLTLPVKPDGSLDAPTDLVERAHRAGLQVHVWTLRADAQYLPAAYKGDAKAEFLQFQQLGVDGVFTDFPDVGVAAYKGSGSR